MAKEIISSTCTVTDGGMNELTNISHDIFIKKGITR